MSTGDPRSVPCKAGVITTTEQSLPTALGMQVHADIRERQEAMEAAVAAEDYVAAAAQRDAIDVLMLRRRKLEIVASAEARKVKYRLGECARPAAASTGWHGGLHATQSPTSLRRAMRTRFNASYCSMAHR